VAGSRRHRLPIIVGAIVIGSIGAASAQQQREVQGKPVQPEVVKPEVREEPPPMMVGPADQPQQRLGQDAEQLLTSLRRALEALQLNDRKAAMQELMQAEEQLDQVAEAGSKTQPWQQIDTALQDAMKALAEDNPKYALIALQRVTEPLQRSDAGGRQDAGQGGEGPDSVLETRSAREVIGAEVVNARGETIAQVSDIVGARAGGDELYAVLEVGGFLGIGDKLVALELDQLEVAEDDKILLPPAIEGQLEEMPIYDREKYEEIR
jgi:PRC-barrel domain